MPRRILWVGLLFAVVGIIALVDFDLTGSGDGLYLFRKGWQWKVSDGILLGDESRFVFGLDVRRSAVDVDREEGGERPRLVYDWIWWDGTGYVRNLLPGGREIVTTFSRWVNEEGRHPSGLFVGGRPPLLPGNEASRTLNRSGMAYYDGRRWLHVWCNANEAIGIGAEGVVIQIFDWDHVESGILVGSPREVRLRSVHRVAGPWGDVSRSARGSSESVSLDVVRHATFRAGEPYFVLTMSVTNAGNHEVEFRYGYGDEPWLGDYGSSEGNVGWVDGRLVYHEEEIDPSQHRFAGYYDFGNEMVSARHDFTEIANFVEWHPDTPPRRVYFSNGVGQSPDLAKQVPLGGNERALTLEWGPVALAPGETAHVSLALGLGETGEAPGVPRKPPVTFEAIEQRMAGR
jgi:hypothetical protein